MENVGNNLGLWLEVGKIAVLVIIGFFIVRTSIQSYNAYTGKNPNKPIGKLKRNIVIFLTIALVLLIVFFYFAFGSGQKVVIRPEESGTNRIVDGYEDEKTTEVLRQEALDQRPDVLKRQDQGFERDAKEADDFVKKALEEAKKKNDNK